MFPNLEAEQARSRHTNVCVAEKLGLTRQSSYEKKKKTGNFKLREIVTLSQLYGASLEYLFAEEPERPATMQTAVV